jgi:signal transduction histidine kinase
VTLARELHDVLAHTLGALSVQLEAIDAVHESGDRERTAELVQNARALVARGLDETAEAVRALREEPVPVADRIAALVDGTDASLRIEGIPRALPPQAGLALYRAAQEAITNARKHAPGTPAELTLAFQAGRTVLTVRNTAPREAPAAPGAGLGLQGMRERIELAGGRLEAGASANVFTVEAAVPA